MAKASASENADTRLLALRRLNSTSGGSSDTELKELQVSPAGCPSTPVVVMTATPVGKDPSSCRKSVGSMEALCVARRSAAGEVTSVMDFLSGVYGVGAVSKD